MSHGMSVACYLMGANTTVLFFYCLYLQEWNMCPILGDVCYCSGTVHEAGCCMVNECHEFECVDSFWECTKRCGNYVEK